MDLEIKYGFLKLTGAFQMRRNHIRYVEAICDCGNTGFFMLSRLKTGKTKSCGCFSKIVSAKRATIHGQAKRSGRHSLYATFHSMMNRCYNEKDRAYTNYGGRGIIVCDEWRGDFVSFYNWAIKNGWQKGLTLDRTMVNEGYSPQNCRFITRAEQNRNTRRNVYLTAFGETKILQEWVRDIRCKIGYNGLKKRIKKGMNHQVAIVTQNLKLIS